MFVVVFVIGDISNILSEKMKTSLQPVTTVMFHMAQIWGQHME